MASARTHRLASGWPSVAASRVALAAVACLGDVRSPTSTATTSSTTAHDRARRPPGRPPRGGRRPTRAPAADRIAGVNVDARTRSPTARRAGRPDRPGRAPTTSTIAEQGGRVRDPQVDTHDRQQDQRDDQDHRLASSPTPCSTSPTRPSTDGERGLLGIAFSTDGRTLYVDYTDTDGNTARGRVPDVDGDQGRHRQPSARELLVPVDQPFPNHNGGQPGVRARRLPLHRRWATAAARGDPHGNGQNTDTLLGKILRIDPDGAAPATCPTPSRPATRSPTAAAATPEIWLYGVRNPWRFSFDRANGDLWIGDVGQDEIEEIDWLPVVPRARRRPRAPTSGGTRWRAPQPLPRAAPLPTARSTPVFDYPHDRRQLLGHRRLRLPGLRHPRPAGRLRVRRLLRRRHPGPAGPQRRRPRRAVARHPGVGGQLTSFGAGRPTASSTCWRPTGTDLPDRAGVMDQNDLMADGSPPDGHGDDSADRPTAPTPSDRGHAGRRGHPLARRTPAEHRPRDLLVDRDRHRPGLRPHLRDRPQHEPQRRAGGPTTTPCGSSTGRSPSASTRSTPSSSGRSTTTPLIVVANYFYGSVYIVVTIFAPDLALPALPRRLPAVAQHAAGRHAARA